MQPIIIPPTLRFLTVPLFYAKSNGWETEPQSREVGTQHLLIIKDSAKSDVLMVHMKTLEYKGMDRIKKH